MEKKLPEVFHNTINKKLSNNKSIFYSAKSEQEEIRKKPSQINIQKKINEIFSSPNYIYKADVIIKTNEKSITTKIIGRNKNQLITMDNEIINIDSIIDITKKTN